MTATRRHTAADCDDDCRYCSACYRATGTEVCNRLCPHALPDADDSEPAVTETEPEEPAPQLPPEPEPDIEEPAPPARRKPGPPAGVFLYWLQTATPGATFWTDRTMQSMSQEVKRSGRSATMKRFYGVSDDMQAVQLVRITVTA